MSCRVPVPATGGSGCHRKGRRRESSQRCSGDESETRATAGEGENELGLGLPTLPGGAAAYIALPHNGRKQRSDGGGGWIQRLLSAEPCRSRASPFSRAVPGPALQAEMAAQARARRVVGRAVFGPCFFVSCSGWPVVLVPNGKKYTNHLIFNLEDLRNAMLHVVHKSQGYETIIRPIRLSYFSAMEHCFFSQHFSISISISQISA
jgi:hypothetical protein